MKPPKSTISQITSKRPVRGRYRLADLIRRMPKSHRTREVDAGKTVGKEVW